jgi:hypothetical protein
VLGFGPRAGRPTSKRLSVSLLTGPASTPLSAAKTLEPLYKVLVNVFPWLPLRSQTWPHRENGDGTLDSVHPKCFATIATTRNEKELAEHEQNTCAIPSG